MFQKLPIPALGNGILGEYQDPHVDCEARFSISEKDGDLVVESSPFNNFSSLFIEYGALTYLNDNYEGGEIYFPDYDLIIKPEVGELILFPGTDRYIHGVKKVTKGNRLVIQSFLSNFKLKYLWDNFVTSTTPIGYVDKNSQFYNHEKNNFNKNNIPLMFKHWGSI